MDHMDQMIREAANNHHPAYNDKAWEKMEQQLDKHLPQKKDRRRFIFLLLFFLLAGGAGTLLLLNGRSGNDKTIATGKNNGTKKERDASTTDYIASNSQNVKEEVQLPENTGDNTNIQLPAVPGNSDEVKTITGKEIKPQNDGAVNDNKPTGPAVSSNDKTVAKAKPVTVVKPKPLNNDVKIKKDDADAVYSKNAEPKINSKQIVANRSEPQKKGRENNYTIADELDKGNDELATTRKKKIVNKSKTKATITSPDLSEDVQADEILADKKKPVSEKEDSKLKVSVSAPGTISDETNAAMAVSAEDNKEKKVTEQDLADLAKLDKEPVKDSAKSAEDKKLLTTDKKPDPPADKKKKENKFSNNFGITVSAGPDMSFVKLNNTGKTTFTYGAGISYNFAKRFTARAGFYVSKKVYEATPDQYHTPGGNYPYLTDIDADCRIYEIPVSLSYSFGQRKKHNWFGNVGLSSFIMKKEDYIYNYKTPAGQTYNYYYSANNQNKHYFSVLNLSAGYQYHFNKRVSIQAEPYLQVPLGGVGMGKIKLNSTGVLFTLTVKPFAGKK